MKITDSGGRRSHLHMRRFNHAHNVRKARNDANSRATLRLGVPAIYLPAPLHAQARPQVQTRLSSPLQPWLTDRTHTLYPSSDFCVLKSKPLLSVLSLFGGSDSGFSSGLAAQIDARNQFVAAIQSIVHPLPAHLHIARTPK